MPDSDRLQREIEEILGKIEQFPEPESPRKQHRRRALRRIGMAISERQQAVARRLARISISQMMLVSFLMILGSFFFRRMFGPLLMEWVMYAGIILFVSAFAIFMFGGGKSNSSRQSNWRGRSIEYRQATLSDRIRHWWKGRSARR